MTSAINCLLSAKNYQGNSFTFQMCLIKTKNNIDYHLSEPGMLLSILPVFIHLNLRTTLQKEIH